MKQMLTLAFAIVAVGFTIGCSKKKGSNAAAVSYYMSNNQCYNSSNQIVDTNLCSGLQYQLIGTTCYQRSNNQVVANNLCTTGTTVNNGYSMNQYGQCVHSSAPTVPVATTLCQQNQTGTCTVNQYGQYVNQYGQACNNQQCGVNQYGQYQCGNNASGNCDGRQLGYRAYGNQIQIVTCGVQYGWDCRGVQMIDVYNGYRTIYCN